LKELFEKINSNYWGHVMSTLALAADERVADVELTEDVLSVRLMDGRTISVPLVWYPRLLRATKEQRKNWRIAGGGYGIHWEEIDEDLSTEGLLRGAPAPRPSSAKVF
jgi:hypothetical protein